MHKESTSGKYIDIILVYINKFLSDIRYIFIVLFCIYIYEWYINIYKFDAARQNLFYKVIDYIPNVVIDVSRLCVDIYLYAILCIGICYILNLFCQIVEDFIGTDYLNQFDLNTIFGSVFAAYSISFFLVVESSTEKYYHMYFMSFFSLFVLATLHSVSSIVLSWKQKTKMENLILIFVVLAILISLYIFYNMIPYGYNYK